MFLYCTSSSSKVNSDGNRAAMASLIFGSIFSIILSIIIVRSLLNLRKSVFPINNTFSVQLSRDINNNLNSSAISMKKFCATHDPKLHFYGTFIAFIILLGMFTTITVIFLKSAFDIHSVNTLDWGSHYLHSTNKAWSVIPILGSIFCFIAAVFFAFKLLEDVKYLRVIRATYTINSLDLEGIKISDQHHMKISNQIKKEWASSAMCLWFLLELISLIFCIFTIVMCIYFAWAILH